MTRAPQPGTVPYFYPRGNAVAQGFHTPAPRLHPAHGELCDVDVVVLPREGEATKLLVSLMATYPRLQGRVILSHAALAEMLDQKSNPALMAWLRDRSLKMDVVDEVDFKNRAIEVSNSRWLWFLSPRALLTEDPLRVARKEIEVLRASIVNFARKTLAGSHVSRDNLEFLIEDGQVIVQQRPFVAEAMTGADSAALCSAFDSGSTLADRHLLMSIGGFRHAPFSPTGDLDLSVRLLQYPARILLSRAVVFLTDEDVSSERTLWNDYKRWDGQPMVMERRSSAMHPRRAEKTKPRIGLLTDQDGWAFANIALQIRKHLSDRFDFASVPLASAGDLRRALLLAADTDLIHFFWREAAAEVFSERFSAALREDGLSSQCFFDEFVNDRLLTTTIFDHLWMEREDIDERRIMFQSIHGYSVANLLLKEFYSDSSHEIPPPLCVTQDGVDTARFHPPLKLRHAARRPVIGWVGNSSWGSPEVDTKGLRTVLRPALEILRRSGHEFGELVVDRVDGYVPHSMMPWLYRRMDVLVISSSMEGTPNPLLEAMASGIAIVATDVGIVREALGTEQEPFILAERSPEAFAGALRELLDDPGLLRNLGEANREMSLRWDWKRMAENYATLFSAVLDGETAR